MNKIAGTSGPAIVSEPTITADPSNISPSAISAEQPILEMVTKNPVLSGIILLLLVLLVALSLYLLLKRKNKKTKPQGPGVDPMNSEPKGLLHIGNVQNIGKRESQQDSFGISDLSNKVLCQEKGLLAIVADGMGGLANGAEVSALVTRTMLGQFSGKPFVSDASQELLNMLSVTNKEVNLFLKNCKDRSGSTMVAVNIKDMKLHWISVGDSRICLVRNGALLQINREHTYASELDQKAAMGEISFEKARNDPQRSALTSYIGMGDIEEIDHNVRPLQLVPGDRILLMSDGVFGTLTDEEILSTMKLDPHEAANELERLILQKNKKGQDNFTGIIIELL